MYSLKSVIKALAALVYLDECLLSCQRLDEFIQKPFFCLFFFFFLVSMTEKSISGIFGLIREAFGDSATGIANI